MVNISLSLVVQLLTVVHCETEKKMKQSNLSASFAREVNDIVLFKNLRIYFPWLSWFPNIGQGTALKMEEAKDKPILEIQQGKD